VTSPFIVTMCASLRAESYNARLLAVAEDELEQLGATFLRYGGLRTLPRYDEDVDTETTVPASVVELRDLLQRADGLLLATPAYNGALPSGLKDVIDWGSRPFGTWPLKGKPVAIITASPGPSGGKASAEYLSLILGLFGSVIVDPISTIAKVTHELEDDGVSVTTRHQLRQTVTGLLDRTVT
jgi:NAD(P)H-dependent FMN reductase